MNKEVSSKAVKQASTNGETSFKRCFAGKSKFPRFKKMSEQDVKAYFPKNNETDWTAQRHRVKTPTLGFTQLKEKGYLPTKEAVSSGTVSMKAGRYFIAVLIDMPEFRVTSAMAPTAGIGVDLGLRDFAICSHKDIPFKNINKTSKVKRLEKKLKREQKRFSRKYEVKKKRGEKAATYSANITNQVKKVQALHLKLTNIRTNYMNHVVNAGENQASLHYHREPEC